MKKLVALLLALVMAFSLVACGSSDKKTSESSTADTETTSSDTNSNDGPYQIVYMCSSFAITWCKNIETAIKTLQSKYDFELLSTDVDYDFDLWMTNVETYCDQGVDGFVMNADATITQRTYEVTSEYKIPWLSESTAVRDDNGTLLTSGVELDAYQVGYDAMEWLSNNYKTYWGDEDIDQSTLGFINIYYSSVSSFNQRCKGGEDAFTKYFPDCKNIFNPDLLAQGNFSSDAAYNEVSPIVSAHPEIKHWFVLGVIDDWSLGATRAIESAGLQDESLVVSVGGETLTSQWDNGYDGCWVACNYFEALDYVDYLVPGIISIIKGEKTMQDIWPEYQESSGFCSVKIEGKMATKDNYKDYVKMTY